MRRPLPLERPLPPRAVALVAHVLCATFARTFHVAAPRLAHLEPDAALHAFREFSAACMEAALDSPAYAAARRGDLERNAFRLGSFVRSVLRPRDDELAALVAYLYAAIRIEVHGNIPGDLVFQRCYFSGRYTPELCAFMSAFDSGFVGGLCGGGSLEFRARITQGDPHCLACFGNNRALSPNQLEEQRSTL